jgi:hypothetical protein
MIEPSFNRKEESLWSNLSSSSARFAKRSAATRQGRRRSRRRASAERLYLGAKSRKATPTAMRWLQKIPTLGKFRTRRTTRPAHKKQPRRTSQFEANADKAPCVMAHTLSALFGVKWPSCPKQACAKGASHVRHPDPPRLRRLREFSESTERAPTWVLTSGACARLRDRGASCSWQRGSRARRHRRNHQQLTVTLSAGLAVDRTETTGQWKIRCKLPPI